MSFTKRLKVLCHINTGLIKKSEEYYVDELIDKKYFRVTLDQYGFDDTYPKEFFNYIINQYITYDKAYGEMQLPVIQENIYDYLVCDPYGYFTRVSKKDYKIGNYKNTHYLDCSQVKYY